MALPLAKRAESLRQSEIRSMTTRAVARGGVNLSQGLCDLPTPEAVKLAACEAINEDNNTYAPLNGKKRLRELIAEKLVWFNGITANPETEITVSSGATGAYTCALLALLEPGDRVLNFEPFYGYHVNLIRLLDFEPVFFRMEQPGWKIDPAALERAIADGVKAVIINTPANPSGKVFTRDELAEIGELCHRHGVWVITDEIYEFITFGGHRHVSLASLPGMFERTVTIAGFSKTLAMTGWRLGYAAGPAGVIEKMSLISDLLYICAPHPLQEGVARALPAFDRAYYQGLADLYDKKRVIITEALEDAGFRVRPLEGTYFLLADYSGVYGEIGSKAAMERLFEETAVASVPAASFYSEGYDRSWLRFCFAKEDRELERAAELLRGKG